MRRREFLKVSLAMAAGLGLERGILGVARATHIPSSSLPANKIIIVGAGLSGLTAAWLLTRKGKQVILLETDDHPGGRVHSYRWPNGQVSEICFEEFFDRSVDAEVNWLVDELGLRSDVVQYPWGGYASYILGTYVQHTSYVQWINGLNWPDPLRDPADHERLAYDFITRDVGYLTTPWQHANREGHRYAEFDNESFADFVLRDFNSSGSGGVNYVSNVFLRPEGGLPNERVSAAYNFANYYLWYNSHGYHLRRGNDQLISQLVNRLPSGSLRLGARVTEVANNRTGTGVTVAYVKDGAKVTDTADVAILTVPHILVPKIVPSLPVDWVKALKALDHSRVIRLALQFSRKFWKEDFSFDGWGAYTDLSPNWINNDSANDNLKTGALSPYVTEPVASTLWGSLTVGEETGPHVPLGEQDTKEVLEVVLADIAKFWPQVRTELRVAKVWAVPYYGPAYPPGYVAGGQYELNQEPFGRIILGGDWVYYWGADDAIKRARDIVDFYIV